MRPPFLPVVLLGVLLLPAACGGGATPDPGRVPADTVVMRDFAFEPEELVVTAGTTVTWTNQESGVAHTTTGDDGAWDSGVLQPGQFQQHTFTDPGRYPYFCSIHPSMRGVVVVEG